MTDHDFTRRRFLGVTLTAGAATLLSAEMIASRAAAQGRTTVTFAQPATPAPQAIMAAANPNLLYTRLVFDCLTFLDADQQPQPRLATGWEVNEASTEIILQLRTDARFHSGRTLTAADVIYSLEQAKLPENFSQMRGVASAITAMEAIDDATLKLTFNEPTGRMFELFEITPIVDSETFPNIQAGETVVGTGAFIWRAYQPGAQLTLERNPDYWGDTIGIETLQILTIRDAQALIAALRSGRADAVFGLSFLDVATIGPGYDNIATGGSVAYVVGLNAGEAPFDDLRARQAVAKAIDRNRINMQVFRGAGTATSLWWQEGTPGWSEALQNHWAFDPDAARAELAALGLAGTVVPVTVDGSDLVSRAIFDIVRYNLEQVGLVVEPDIIDAAEFNTRNSASTLGTCFMHKTGFGSLSAVACATATAHLRPGGGTHFDSPELRALIAAAAVAAGDARAEANAALGAYLVEQAFNLPTVAAQLPIVARPDLGGLSTTNAFQFIMPATFQDA